MQFVASQSVQYGDSAKPSKVHAPAQANNSRVVHLLRPDQGGRLSPLTRYSYSHDIGLFMA